MTPDDQLRESARLALAEFGKAVLVEVRWRTFEHRVMIFATVVAATAVIIVAGAYGLRYLRDIRQGQPFNNPNPPRHERRRKRR